MTQIYIQASAPPMHERHSLFPENCQQIPRSNTHTPQLSRDNIQRSRCQPSTPMSDSRKGFFEVTSPKVGEMHRPGHEGSHSREQLPPLSSLFGAATPRPSSAYSNRHSPTFPAVSPQDPRHLAAPLYPKRPHEASYFQTSAALDRPFAYSSRPEQAERRGLPPPPPSRNALPGQKPESPQYDTRRVLSDASRPSYPPNWSPRSESSRSGYPGRDTSSSFRTHTESHLPPSYRLERKYLEAHQAPPDYPPTPNTATSDIVTTKDGLGPKIWTGTHFLPRFVRQAEVPGEGMCYFYDDGTHCKTVIDGEIVNAHWGVTKAGKPRKRLAIACITCREKKIKCDPDYPRCVQCEKFGRVCKFKNAPRGGQGSPDTPPAEPEDITSRPGSSREDRDSFGEKRGNSQSASPRPALDHGSPESEARHAKRQRTGYADFTPVPSEASPQLSLVHQIPSPPTPVTDSFASSSLDPHILREWHANPYSSNAGLVTELMTIFFRHAPETAKRMFNEQSLTTWVLSTTEKSLDDLMLIYAILATAATFSPKSEHRVPGSRYAAIARFACEKRRFSVQLVRSRLLLAHYYFADDQSELGWEYCGGALSLVSGLKQNLDIEQTQAAFQWIRAVTLHFLA